MTSGWFAALKDRVPDVAAYIEERKRCYLGRWAEAARFLSDGATVLDIGGGNLFPELLRYISQRRFDYHYIDVDLTAVQASSELGARYGFGPIRFKKGFNDVLEHPTGTFDAVFSSHCLEHSFDLEKSFREVARVLKPGGWLLMAVPLGWEPNPEHPYFFSDSEWLGLIRSAGFEIRVSQIGCEYPESGFDLFVAAKKSTGPTPSFSVEPKDYKKDSFSLFHHSSDHFSCAGEFAPAQDLDAVHLRGADWCVSFDVPDWAVDIRFITLRHEWSGIVNFSSPAFSQDVDLYSWYSFAGTIHNTNFSLTRASDRVVKLKSNGRNPLSLGTEMVLFGALCK
jgi:SAM-dependent methyltransferase